MRIFWALLKALVKLIALGVTLCAKWVWMMLWRFEVYLQEPKNREWFSFTRKWDYYTGKRKSPFISSEAVEQLQNNLRRKPQE